jgi:hypothetical protein
VWFGVGWLALPAGGREEKADTCLTQRVEMMNDVAEYQVTRLDQHSGFLAGLADYAMDN